MKLNENQTVQLLTALNVCKTLGIESVMVSEGKIRGAKASLDAAIISTLNLDLPPTLNIGIGRVDELVKRLGVFDKAEINIAENERGDAKSLEVVAGRSKMQFRCTSSNMIQFPKSNDDEAIASLTLSSAEVKQLVKAVNTMGAEHVTIQLTRQGAVNFTAVDPSTNDALDITLESPGELLADEKSFVFNYLSGLLMKTLTAAQTGSEPVTLIVGAVGSISTNIHGHDVFVFAYLTGDEEYEED